jgi:hypothetical protein
MGSIPVLSATLFCRPVTAAADIWHGRSRCCPASLEVVRTPICWRRCQRGRRQSGLRQRARRRCPPSPQTSAPRWRSTARAAGRWEDLVADVDEKAHRSAGGHHGGQQDDKDPCRLCRRVVHGFPAVTVSSATLTHTGPRHSFGPGHRAECGGGTQSGLHRAEHRREVMPFRRPCEERCIAARA